LPSRLGVPQLEQYWSRIREGRQSPNPSCDDTLLCGLNAGVHETIAFLHREAPTLEEFEAWILRINGGSLDSDRIERLKAALEGTLDRGTPPAAGSPDAALSAEDLAFWEEHGYVILHDAVTPEQCDAAAHAIYEYLSVDPEKPDTWYSNPAGHSIWVNLLRHRAFQANRASRRIHAAFAQLWGRTDLWPTIDQGGFNPPETARWQFPGPHLHWDVSIVQPIPFGTQGILYLTDTAADQGAFTCVPGFQRQIAHWLSNLAQGANPRDRQLLDRLTAIPIAGRRGDLIIWHHALPHGSSPNRSKLPRVAQYVNLRPSQWDVSPVWL